MPTPASTATISTATTGAKTYSGRRGIDRCASPANQAGSARSLASDAASLRHSADVDVHRAHRQDDGEHRRCVAAGTTEADLNEVGEGDPRPGSRGDADGRNREPDVEDGDEREGDRHRARQVALGPAEVSGKLSDRLPADEEPDEDVAAVPIAQIPCGANGVQLCPPRVGSATAIARASTTISTDESASWNPEEMRRPNTSATRTVANIARPTAAATGVPEPVRSAT